MIVFRLSPVSSIHGMLQPAQIVVELFDQAHIGGDDVVADMIARKLRQTRALR